jgi:alcohol dehydrogenase
MAQLHEFAAALGFRRALVVADEGVIAAGHVGRARRIMENVRIESFLFDAFGPNPDGDMVERGRAFAAAHAVDSIVAVGGGTSLDCAKGINFVLTNGGRIEDYWGYGKAARPMLPSIGVPTTTGTGSEAQSYAVISHAGTHRKLACGDPKAAFRVAILDPELALTQPVKVRAAAGYDAISHAVETAVTTERTTFSLSFAREAWLLLSSNYEAALRNTADVEVIGAMQLGAHWAGLAIENSMLGAAHACANPLTQYYGTLHAEALAVMLPHVVRWNSPAAREAYAAMCNGALPERLVAFAQAGELPARLRDVGVPRDAVAKLAAAASEQWTGRFNPRPFDSAGAMELYECAW